MSNFRIREYQNGHRIICGTLAIRCLGHGGTQEAEEVGSQEVKADLSYKNQGLGMYYGSGLLAYHAQGPGFHLTQFPLVPNSRQGVVVRKGCIWWLMCPKLEGLVHSNGSLPLPQTN